MDTQYLRLMAKAALDHADEMGWHEDDLARTLAHMAIEAADLLDTRPAAEDVHGPTGATIAKVGTVRISGDGLGEFAHQGDMVQFRITMSDDESNADRYYRGFNDGYELGYERGRART